MIRRLLSSAAVFAVALSLAGKADAQCKDVSTNGIVTAPSTLPASVEVFAPQALASITTLSVVTGTTADFTFAVSGKGDEKEVTGLKVLFSVDGTTFKVTVSSDASNGGMVTQSHSILAATTMATTVAMTSSNRFIHSMTAATLAAVCLNSVSSECAGAGLTLVVTVPSNVAASKVTDSKYDLSIITPNNNPTTSPTKAPTTSPTKAPTKAPTTSPTKAPTTSPTTSPTKAPTKSPTTSPTKAPTKSPTTSPTKAPTKSPTTSPTKAPTKSPTTSPTKAPTKSPTTSPTKAPTKSPTTSPTKSPTSSPTFGAVGDSCDRNVCGGSTCASGLSCSIDNTCVNPGPVGTNGICDNEFNQCEAGLSCKLISVDQKCC